MVRHCFVISMLFTRLLTERVRPLKLFHNEDGQIEQAREHLLLIKKQWMRYALLAEIERRLGHRERAIQYAQEAVNASNDVERYMLVKE